MPAHVLIADDDPGVRSGLAAVCRAAGHRTSECESGKRTLELAREQAPDLVLLDLEMGDLGGLEVLSELAILEDAPAVVLVTGFADVGTAVQGMRTGAAHVLEKPVHPATVQEVIASVLASRAARSERDRLRDEISSLRSGPVVGTSRAVRRVLEHVQRVASTPNTTALITGESGVGKELLARAVHEHSARASGPFVALNCAALSESLLEAELFGYEPGAFTGGKPKGHRGLAAAAEGGSLFLDEVGELAPSLQAKLLRVLQERSYRRVGGNVDVPMDVRIIASTNRDLVSMVDEGTFREDLYYRLNVLSIHMPPLRERPEDIAPICRHFLTQFGRELGRKLTGFSPAAMERLTGHAWPGNVRELKNTIERATLFAHDGEVRPEHLGLQRSRRPAPREALTGGLPLPSLRLKSMEEALIRRALEECSGNRSRAARELGINRTTLYKKLKQFGIEA